jgi:acetyltransferase-like isoleucine patch superfamily enzyme
MAVIDSTLETAPAAAPNPPLPLSLSFTARLWRALREDIQPLNVRLLLANTLVSALPTSSFARLRTAIYRLGGVHIGEHSLILGKLNFTGSGSYGKRLTIGTNSIINAHCFFDLNAEITIGDWVSIGHHVTFITADHALGPALCRAGAMKPMPIVIKDGSWIGACCSILPGVDFGPSSVVAAGSVLSGSVPAHKVVGGAPARPLKSLPSEP